MPETDNIPFVLPFCGGHITKGNYGMFFPHYPGERVMLGYNNGDRNDPYIIGALQTDITNKQRKVPPGHKADHLRMCIPIMTKTGDGWSYTGKNMDLVFFPDGSISMKGVSLKIIANSTSGTTATLPTKTTENTMELDSPTIKLGSGASLGAARITDDVNIDPLTLLIWLNTHTHSVPGVLLGGPGTVTATPLVNFTGPKIGDISSSSTKTKIE